MGGALLGLAALLLILATAGGLSRRFGQSAIPAYILLGLATRSTLVDESVVAFVEAIGIALLLFFVGLEFSILRLRQQARRLGKAGAIDLLVNFPVGFVGGLALGWGPSAAFLLGAALYISSSAIVARNVSVLRRAAHPETEIALGVLVAEDIIMAVLLASVALWIPLPGRGVPAAATFAGIFALALLLTVLAGPVVRLMDAIGERLDDEPLRLGVLGMLLLFSGAAVAVGMSEAIGAFAAGLLVGASKLEPRVESQFAPLGGLFAALFFFAFGLTIDAATLPPVIWPGLALAMLALLSKLAGGLWIGRTVGLSPATGLSLGFTLVPRGEFSVVVAAYGAAIGHPRLSSLIAVVVVTLAVAGTVLTQAGPRLGASIVAAVGGWRRDAIRAETPDESAAAAAGTLASGGTPPPDPPPASGGGSRI